MLTSRPSHAQIWCFVDGKPGHENQSLGLIEAVERCGSQGCEVHRIPVATDYPSRLLGRPLEGADHGTLAELPPPDLLIGAGHATHLPLWRARRRFGGRSIVLMKPSLPLRCFDLCVIPDAHRMPNPRANVVMTRGVLNRIQRSNQLDSEKAICLLGGPSAHFQWNSDVVRDQLHSVIGRAEDLSWTIASSRRTPPPLLDALAVDFPQHRVVPHDQVSRDWLPAQLRSHRTAWVSEDSVSMTYEAVTAGASVGVLELPRPRHTRVTVGMDRLAAAGYVTRWSDWMHSGQFQDSAEQLCESDRLAQIVLHRFLPGRLAADPAVA